MPSPPFPSAAERHESSRRLYLSRDLDGYMDLFSPTLVYRQATGQVLTREQLAHDVAEQFRRMRATDWDSYVESEERGPDRVIEIVRQSGIYTARAFGFIHRRWRFSRRGQYTWTVHDGRWRISEVHVFEEQVTPDGTTLGWSPKPRDQGT